MKEVRPEPLWPTSRTILGVCRIRYPLNLLSKGSRPTRCSARDDSIGRRSKGLPRNGGRSRIVAEPSAIIDTALHWVHNVHVFSRLQEADLTRFPNVSGLSIQEYTVSTSVLSNSH